MSRSNKTTKAWPTQLGVARTFFRFSFFVNVNVIVNVIVFVIGIVSSASGSQRALTRRSPQPNSHSRRLLFQTLAGTYQCRIKPKVPELVAFFEAAAAAEEDSQNTGGWGDFESYSTLGSQSATGGPSHCAVGDTSDSWADSQPPFESSLHTDSESWSQ